MEDYDFSDDVEEAEQNAAEFMQKSKIYNYAAL